VAQNNGDDDSKFKHLLWAVGGALAGAWWVKNQTDEAQKSRAELDAPEMVEKVTNEIGNVLDSWEPDEDCETEEDFVSDLAEYLNHETGFEVEEYPPTREGRPDILVEGVLALEVKLRPSKGERDRCIGQCAGYSRLWVTWIILIDAPPSGYSDLERLLADKGMERILLWDFH
jgi:hypothetical protein